MATNETGIGALSLATAEEIRVWMTRRRVSQARLASELGVSAAWVSYRLNGQVDLSLTEVERIAGALEVEVSALLPAPSKVDHATIYSRSGDDGTALLDAEPIPGHPTGQHIPHQRSNPRTHHRAETRLSSRRHASPSPAADRRTGRAHRPAA